MPEQMPHTWPPAPQIPAPERPQEEFLTNLLLTPAKQIVSPLSLCVALRQERGRDWRTCRATVRDYCDRHGIFPQPRGLRAWLPALPTLCLAGGVAGMIVSQSIFTHLLSHLPFGPTQSRLIQEQLRWGNLMAGVVYTATAVSLLHSFFAHRKQRRDSAAARQAVADWVRAEAGGAAVSV